MKPLSKTLKIGDFIYTETNGFKGHYAVFFGRDDEDPNLIWVNWLFVPTGLVRVFREDFDVKFVPVRIITISNDNSRVEHKIKRIKYQH